MSEDDSGLVDFGTQLLRHRVAREFTQEELASRSGISVRAIRDMERGRARGPQRRTVELLAHALELDGQGREQLLRGARVGRARSVVEPSTQDALTPTSPTVSWQLPPDIEWLRGRGPELAALHRALEPGHATTRRSAGVVCISGQPGVGKTALAIRAAHDLAQRFPDGRFFVSLRGMEPRPADPADVCATLLRSLGVADQQIPPSLDERVGHFRSLVYERRVLIVLDNAHDEAQVRPLLPSGPGCAALITSRRTMVGLSEVVRVLLNVLDADSARELLAGIVGSARLAAEPSAVDELVALCGYLPLALRIVGSQMASRPHWSFARLAAQLRDESSRLHALNIGEVSVLSAFEVSYRQLSVQAQRLLRRASLISGPSFGLDIAAVLLDDNPQAALLALDELVEGSLMDASAGGRYGVHDLTRMFARARLAEHDREQAARLQVRADDWFLARAAAAGQALFPEYSPDQPGALTRDQAIAVLDSEAGNYLPALLRAAAAGRHGMVSEFVAAMHWYSEI